MTTLAPTTTVPPPPTVAPSTVITEVLNGYGATGAATRTAAELSEVGFRINGTGNASSYTYTENEIEYPPGLEAAAQTLAEHVAGATRLIESDSIPAGVVDLVLGSSFEGVRQA